MMVVIVVVVMIVMITGFIGADRFHFVYAGCMLALNTFGGEVCMMVTVLAVVRGLGLGQGLGLRRDVPIETSKRKIDIDLTGPPVCSDWTGRALAHWCAYRLWLLAATAGCCCLHRRHLMVWAVFAPKFAFEGEQNP